MAEVYAHELSISIIAQICQYTGWTSASKSSLEILEDILEKFYHEMGKIIRCHMEHAERSKPTLGDIVLSFDALGISIKEINEYMNEIPIMPFVQHVTSFPIKKPNKLDFLKFNDLPSYINEYLPPLPVNQEYPNPITEANPISQEDITEITNIDDDKKNSTMILNNQIILTDFNTKNQNKSEYVSIKTGTLSKCKLPPKPPSDIDGNSSDYSSLDENDGNNHEDVTYTNLNIKIKAEIQPKENYLTTSSLNLNETQILTPIKRKVGRPRKYNIEESLAIDFSISETSKNLKLIKNEIEFGQELNKTDSNSALEKDNHLDSDHSNSLTYKTTSMDKYKSKKYISKNYHDIYSRNKVKGKHYKKYLKNTTSHHYAFRHFKKKRGRKPIIKVFDDEDTKDTEVILTRQKSVSVSPVKSVGKETIRKTEKDIAENDDDEMSDPEFLLSPSQKYHFHKQNLLPKKSLSKSLFPNSQISSPAKRMKHETPLLYASCTIIDALKSQKYEENNTINFLENAAKLDITNLPGEKIYKEVGINKDDTDHVDKSSSIIIESAIGDDFLNVKTENNAVRSDLKKSQDSQIGQQLDIADLPLISNMSPKPQLVLPKIHEPINSPQNLSVSNDLLSSQDFYSISNIPNTFLGIDSPSILSPSTKKAKKKKKKKDKDKKDRRSPRKGEHKKSESDYKYTSRSSLSDLASENPNMNLDSVTLVENFAKERQILPARLGIFAPQFTTTTITNEVFAQILTTVQPMQRSDKAFQITDFKILPPSQDSLSGEDEQENFDNEGVNEESFENSDAQDNNNEDIKEEIQPLSDRPRSPIVPIKIKISKENMKAVVILPEKPPRTAIEKSTNTSTPKNIVSKTEKLINLEKKSDGSGKIFKIEKNFLSSNIVKNVTPLHPMISGKKSEREPIYTPSNSEADSDGDTDIHLTDANKVKDFPTIGTVDQASSYPYYYDMPGGDQVDKPRAPDLESTITGYGLSNFIENSRFINHNSQTRNSLEGSDSLDDLDLLNRRKHIKTYATPNLAIINVSTTKSSPIDVEQTTKKPSHIKKGKKIKKSTPHNINKITLNSETYSSSSKRKRSVSSIDDNEFEDTPSIQDVNELKILGKISSPHLSNPLPSSSSKPFQASTNINVTSPLLPIPNIILSNVKNNLTSNMLAGADFNLIANTNINKIPPLSNSSVERTVITETLGSVVINEKGEKIWICPACTHPDDGSPMIGCDSCDDWYHWVCVNITEAPAENENWYCSRCLAKSIISSYSSSKKKRRRKR
ncbi:uncharacterized protein LOC135925491 isoform X3 [Gordionus sp. m RMFG-2023]|uniref:uncharacterized protein LOC135925491 isoform X3 n=1 Tax=Gordionus sp. m RMFG-2023 TaxID=3053472 RepID=UPI0031FDA030